MVITLDISNTNLTLGAVEDGCVLFQCRLSSSANRTADEYAVLLRLISQQRGVDLCQADGAIISSVVPQLTSVLREAVIIAFGKTPLVLGPGVKSGLNIRIDDPTELGADFVASAVAAIDRYCLPCVTVDLGTATSIGVLDKKGSYIGGILCPGVMVSQNALASRASQLPNVSLDAPGKVICRSTAECMKSGLIYGTASMLDGLLERIEEELGSPVSVVATGDWAENVISHCRRKNIILDEELLMRGLWLIYKKNQNPGRR